MSSSPDPNFRYFLAGLKPLGRPIVWVPLGLTLLVGLGLWQYRSQLSTLNSGQWNPENPPNETQWIGDKPSSDKLDAVPIEQAAPTGQINPDTGLPIPASSLPTDSTLPNSSAPPVNLSNNRPNSPVPLPNGFPLPSANTVLTPANPIAPPTNSPQRSSRPQIFAPLMPSLSNPSAILPASPSANSGNRPTPRRPEPNYFTPTTTDPADNPLQRAIQNNNARRRLSTSPQLPNTSPATSPIPGNVAPSAVQPPSIYSDAYRPPAYPSNQSPNLPNNAPNSNNLDRNNSQYPAFQSPNANRYGTGEF
jgi:hypothetical protein